MAQRLCLAFALAAGLGLLGSPAIQAADKKAEYPHMHHALHELREARTELKEADHDFGGHREKALKDIDEAIKQIDKALKAKGDDLKTVAKPDVDYTKYKHHPHIHHAIHELKETRTELQVAKHDFGGHREQALKDVDRAIKQLELALEFAAKK
jgi:tetratricopeptide (TPR) repeat protein